MKRSLPFKKLPLILAMGMATGLLAGQAFAVEPAEGAVVFDQDMALPTMPDWDGTIPDSDASPVCIDDQSGLLVAGCDAAIGTEGPQGPQGDIGATGPQGDVGAQGPQGDVGAQGPQGDAGAQGPQGDAGAQGPQGDAGAQGPQGDVGAQGPQGDVGAQGPQGDAGAQGPQGDTGAQGPQGDVGAQGPQGDTGATGPQGPQGATGATGPQGPQGATGPQGDIGATGPQGDIGPQGPQGPEGSFDSSNFVTYISVHTGTGTDQGLVAYCDTGDIVLGGGGWCQSKTTLQGSGPVSNTGWRVRCINQSGDFAVSTLVEAVCLDIDGNHVP